VWGWVDGRMGEWAVGGVKVSQFLFLFLTQSLGDGIAFGSVDLVD
jgi:hypothetical protein